MKRWGLLGWGGVVAEGAGNNQMGNPCPAIEKIFLHMYNFHFMCFDGAMYVVYYKLFNKNTTFWVKVPDHYTNEKYKTIKTTEQRYP